MRATQTPPPKTYSRVHNVNDALSETRGMAPTPPSVRMRPDPRARLTPRSHPSRLGDRPAESSAGLAHGAPSWL